VQAKEAKITAQKPDEGYFPYLQVTYGDQQRATSSVQRLTATPSWNENFVFKVSDLSQDVLVQCYHWNGKNEGPGLLLGMARIKVANLLADFDESEGSSALGSNTESGSGSGAIGRSRYLGQPGAKSPSNSGVGSSRTKQSSSPIAGSAQQVGGLPSVIHSTAGRGAQRRAAMKQKGRVHKHGRLRFQESQKWYAFTDLEGQRIGAGAGIRIRLRPWAPAGMHKQLKIQKQQDMAQAPASVRGGFRNLFSFGRQPVTQQLDDSGIESSSGDSLSTLAESEGDEDYSSADEIENEVPPNWSRKPAHLAAPRDMTEPYRNLFGDHTLEEQLKHLLLKQAANTREEKTFKTDLEQKHHLKDHLRLERKMEVDMMLAVVNRCVGCETSLKVV